MKAPGKALEVGEVNDDILNGYFYHFHSIFLVSLLRYLIKNKMNNEG